VAISLSKKEKTIQRIHFFLEKHLLASIDAPRNDKITIRFNHCVQQFLPAPCYGNERLKKKPLIFIT
jgi:hypothetical protein